MIYTIVGLTIGFLIGKYASKDSIKIGLIILLILSGIMAVIEHYERKKLK